MWWCGPGPGPARDTDRTPAKGRSSHPVCSPPPGRASAHPRPCPHPARPCLIEPARGHTRSCAHTHTRARTCPCTRTHRHRLPLHAPSWAHTLMHTHTRTHMLLHMPVHTHAHTQAQTPSACSLLVPGPLPHLGLIEQEVARDCVCNQCWLRQMKFLTPEVAVTGWFASCDPSPVAPSWASGPSEAECV